MRAANATLLRTAQMFASRLAPPDATVDVVEQEGSDGLAVDSPPVRRLQRLFEQGVVGLRVELVLERHRIGDHDGGAEPEPVGCPHGGDYLLGLPDRPVDVVAGIGDVEAGEPQRPVADDGDAQCLEPLQGRRDVEDRLHPGTDDCYRRTGQRRQVGGLVEGLGRPAVHAADPAGGEHANPRETRQGGSRRDRGGRVAAGRRRERQFSHACLGHVVSRGEDLQLGGAQPDRRPALGRAHGGRNNAGSAQHGLKLQGDLEVSRIAASRG